MHARAIQDDLMDENSRSKNQLASFRIKELKDVLTRLGLPKQGKKQVLMDKIMAVLSPTEWQNQLPHRARPGSVRSSVTREEATKVIDDIYRKLRGPGAAVELASLHRNVSTTSLGAARSEEGSTWEVRCPCGIAADDETTIQCEDTTCNVWQHLSCVVIPDKPMEGVEPDVPKEFYCDLCRIKACDPFSVSVSHPLYPVKFFAPPGSKMEGANPMHGLERSFTLSKHDRDLLHKPHHDLQVWCVLLNDKVPFRMHWPAFAELRINGVTVRVHNRGGTQLLGANGRDDGPGIISCTKEGSNRISFQACDARAFCIGVRIIRRLSVDQVMNLIPSASAGETMEEALARVNRCINGSGEDAGEDDDSDLEVVSDSVTVNLSCPMSGSRINTAGRFKPCGHMSGFDLRTFVEMNQRARKWQCPVCMKNYTLEQLIIDPFFTRIAQALNGYNEDVKEVELKADGFWRPILEGDTRSKEPWRTSDGSFVLANGVQKPVAVVKEEEEDVRRPLKIGIKRTHDGTWTVNKSINRAWSTKEPIKAKDVSLRSSSATDSNNEDDTRSVNQEPYNEYTGETGVGAESLPWSKRIKPTVVPEAPPKENRDDVIVLTDSDEESGSPGGTFNCRQHQQSHPPPRSANGTVNLPTDGAIGLASHWPQQPQYGFFGSNATESSDYARESLPDYGVTGSAFSQQDDEEMEATKGGFRLFLPPQPAREQPQSTQRRHVVTTDEDLDDSWFSLSLGGGDNLNPDHQFLRDRSTTVGNYYNTTNNNHNNGSRFSIHLRRNHPSENCYRVQDDSCSG